MLGEWMNECTDDVCKEADKGILKFLQYQAPEQTSLPKMEKCAFGFKLCSRFFFTLKGVSEIVESCLRSGWEIKEEGDADSFPWAGKIYNIYQTMERNHPSAHRNQRNKRGLGRSPPFPPAPALDLHLFVFTKALYLRAFMFGSSHSCWDNKTRGGILGQVPACAFLWELGEGMWHLEVYRGWVQSLENWNWKGEGRARWQLLFLISPLYYSHF